MTTCEENKVLGMVTDTHNVSSVRLFLNGTFSVDLRPVLVPGDTHDIVSRVFFRLLHTVITPDTYTSIPAYSNELSILLFFRLVWLEHTA